MVRELSRDKYRINGVIVDIPSSDFKLEFEDFDYLALSYLKSEAEIADLKNRYLRKQNRKIAVVAKIENRSALKNLESIIDSADAVMVARGDLAAEVNFYELAYFQKTIIDKCRIHRKPVIVATEMLMSMTNSSLPTRAEATDVANAVFDGADALMLSQETTIGRFPTETVKTMNEIVTFSENTDELRKVELITTGMSDEIIKAAVEIASNNKGNIKAVVAFTKSGNTARSISAFRLKIPVFAISDSPEVLTNLNLAYGVIPYLEKFKGNKFDNESAFFGKIANIFKWKKGDNIILIHGNNWLTSGSVNTLSVKTV